MLHPKALLLRNELLDTKLTDLMISAKMKELYVLSAIGLKEPNVTN